MSPPASQTLDAMTGRLRLAATSALRRWRSPQPAPRDDDHRRFDALMILLVIGMVVIVAIEADEPAARAVHGLPNWIKAVFGQITYLGLSGYMFTLAGLALFGALLARGLGRGAGRWWSAPPGPLDPADRRCKGTQSPPAKTRFLSFLPFLGSQEGGQKKLAA